MAVPPTVTATLATAAAEYQAAQPAAPLRILSSEPATVWHKLDHLLYLPVLLTLSGILQTYNQSVWTLTYRRLTETPAAVVVAGPVETIEPDAAG